jgi:hypothetical protein
MSGPKFVSIGLELHVGLLVEDGKAGYYWMCPVAIQTTAGITTPAVGTQFAGTRGLVC